MVMPAADAVLQQRDGRTVLRFERLLRHSPERVWRALTEQGELERWHPTPFALDAAGARVRFGGEIGDGRLVVHDPPRTLAYAWGEDELRWDLRPHDDGTLLVLEHTFDDRWKAARDAAGWHLCLDALAAALDGAPRPAGATAAGDDGADAIPSEWAQLNSSYEQRFEIPHERATPPPTNQGTA